MSTPKFKVGDILRVVRRSSFADEGSKIRNNFIVCHISKQGDNEKYIYCPDDGERGAYECQLEYAKISDWRGELNGIIL